jgi:WD40 repeat protein/tetratricopeptide (TPR) repeat protein
MRQSSVASDLVASLLMVFLSVEFYVADARAFDGTTPLPDGPPGEVLTLEGHTSVTQFVSFLPDGRHLVTSGRPGLLVWDVKEARTLRKFALIGVSAVSPDGKVVAVVSRGEIKLVETGTAKTVSEVTIKPTGTVRVLAFSPDGKRLACAGDGNVVQLWNAESGTHERDLKGHTKTVRAIGFGPDGSTIVSAGYDRTVHVWNVATGKAHRPPFKVPLELWSVQVSPDGRYVLGAGRSSEIYLWSLATGQEVRRLSGHIAFVHRAAFASDGRRVVSCADDKTVRCWDLQTGRELARFHEHSCNVLDVAISPDGRFAASVAGGATIDGKWTPGDDFKVRVWRLPRARKLLKEGLNLTGIAGGNDGPFRKLKGISSDVLAMDMSADGRIFATGEKDGSIRLWGMETGKETAKFGSSKSIVRSLSLSSAGKQLVTAAEDGVLRLWDVSSRKELLSCPASKVGGRILSVDFLADNHRVVAGLHGSVRIWDTSDDSVTVLGAKNIHIHEVTTSNDGATIAAACHDAVVRVWDAFSGELLHKLEGHTEEVQGVAFSPDGATLASCSRDATVRIWNVGTGELLQTITGHTKWIYSVEFLADGRRVMTGSGPQEGWIRTWDIQTGKQVWMFGTDWRHTRHIAATPDARYAVTANSDTVTILRLPVLKNMTPYETYELARRNEGPDKRIAILDFVDQGPSVELAPLRTALSELLTARLHQYRRVSTVERLQVQQFLKETDLGASGLVDPQTAQRAGKTLTADYLLSGSFSGDGDTITVNAALTNTNAKQPLAQWTVTGKSNELFDIEKRLIAKTLTEMGIAAPTIETMEPAKSGASPTVAMMSFQNLGSVATQVLSREDGVSDAEMEALQAGLGELLQVGLTAVPDLKLVEREALEKVIQEQKLTMSGAVDPGTAARIAKLAGASQFIYGSFLQSGGKITVVARLADTETAAVLSTEIAEGPTDDISSMIETLAMRLATRLNVTPPQDTARLVRLAMPVRKLEAMAHHSRGVELARRGNLEAAFASFDRALLIEPKNLNIHMLCVQLAYKGVRNDLLIRACENALAQPFPPHRRHERQYVYNYYINGLAASGLTSKRAEIVQRQAREFPRNASNQQSSRYVKLRVLRKTDRAKAIAIHEEGVRRAKARGNVSNIASELSSLYRFYKSENVDGDENSPEITLDSAQQSIKVAERLMTLLKGRRDGGTRLTAQYVVRSAAKALYRKNAGDRYQTYLLSPEQRIEFNERLKATFGWDVGSRKLLTFELGELYKSTSQFDLAVAAYRDYLASSVYVPKIIDGYAGKSFSIDPWSLKQADIQYEIARILHRELKRSDDAIAEYQRYVRQFGLATADGPKVWNALHDLGTRPDFPKRSALICGGTTASVRSWQKVLAPQGFTVHHACEAHPVFADLTPYDLVILAKWGDLPLDPVEVFALRSYVATGGSLLAVVTPFWEAAAPGIHGPLLSLFDV